MSDELKLKLSLAKKGKVFTEEHRKNLSLSHKGKMPSNLDTFKNSRLGKTNSDEWKKLMSEKFKGRVMSKEWIEKIGLSGKGRIPWNKGLKQKYNYICIVCSNAFTSTQKSRKFCSIKCSSTQNAGSNNWRWVEDRTKIIGRHNRNFHDSEMKQWRINVYKRDNYKCKISNEECSGRIEAHHILTWKDHPELRYEITNGITLCHFHHPRKRKDEIEFAPLYRKLIDNYIQVKD